MKKTTLTYLSMILFFFMSPTFALQGHTELWTGASFLESFSKDSRFKYYLEPQLRFIDNQYTFNQALMMGGLGYQVKTDVILLAGLSYVLTKSNNTGEMFHEDRIWQQINWNMPVAFNLTSRTRLEERKLTNNPEVAYRLRERLFARFPFLHWQNHSLSLFDEVFFNLNRPDWVAPHFFAQNRVFIGIGTQLSKTAVVDVGYLNQYIIVSPDAPNQLRNGLLISLTVVD